MGKTKNALVTYSASWSDIWW